MISKTMKAILHALSYGNIELESSRRMADLKQLDAMRIFVKKLDARVYNGEHEVPVRLYFPTEEAMQAGIVEGNTFPILLFFHGGGWVTESVENYDRVCARMAQATAHIVVSVEYRLAPEHKFPVPLEDCYAAAKALYTNQLILNTDPEKITIIGDSAGGNLTAAVCLMARDKGEFTPRRQILIYPALGNCYTEEEAVDLICTYGKAAFIAHPLLYGFGYKQIEGMIEDLKPYGLSGLEVYHSSNNAYESGRLREIARAHGLLISGGSDFHGAAKPDISVGRGRGGLRITEAVFHDIQRYCAGESSPDLL